MDVYSALTRDASSDPSKDSGAPKSLYVVPSTRASTLQVRLAPVQNWGVAVARLAIWFPGTHAVVLLVSTRLGELGVLYLIDTGSSQQEDMKAVALACMLQPQHLLRKGRYTATGVLRSGIAYCQEPALEHLLENIDSYLTTPERSFRK